MATIEILQCSHNPNMVIPPFTPAFPPQNHLTTVLPFSGLRLSLILFLLKPSKQSANHLQYDGRREEILYIDAEKQSKVSDSYTHEQIAFFF